MTALVPTRGLANSLSELFEPVDADPIGQLLAEHAERWETIESVAAMFASESVAACLPYFLTGAEVSDTYHAQDMFSREKVARALKALDAQCWERALEATDVLSVMPAERREQWRKQIQSLEVPPFSESTIKATLGGHLAARPRYFAERVDGLFRALSPEHKTNLPTGFRSKLIINYVFDAFGFSSQRGLDTLTDLRIVVAKFMGRNDIGDGGQHVRKVTGDLVKHARHARRGEWVTVDGGAIEIKAHKCGTCHVRVHDEIAWRLNAVLAYQNPGAIPESACTRPKRGKGKKPSPTVELITRPLPFAVVKAIADLERKHHEPRVYSFSYWASTNTDKHVKTEVARVMESIGAAVDGETFRFDYEAREVIGDLVASGCIPDHKSHQFYPTPPSLAARVVELAEVGPEDTVLEPSAGQGAIAELLPKDRTVCIEASALHCSVLRAKGLNVVAGDFLRSMGPDIAAALGRPTVTRVVMNPPFDRGQWQAHVEHASTLLAPGGRLVAILPSSAPKRLELPGFALTWSDPIDGEFSGASISVVILVARRS